MLPDDNQEQLVRAFAGYARGDSFLLLIETEVWKTNCSFGHSNASTRLA